MGYEDDDHEVPDVLTIAFNSLLGIRGDESGKAVRGFGFQLPSWDTSRPSRRPAPRRSFNSLLGIHFLLSLTILALSTFNSLLGILNENEFILNILTAFNSLLGIRSWEAIMRTGG